MQVCSSFFLVVIAMWTAIFHSSSLPKSLARVDQDCSYRPLRELKGSITKQSRIR